MIIMIMMIMMIMMIHFWSLCHGKSGCCYVKTKSQCVSLFNLSSLAIFVDYQWIWRIPGIAARAASDAPKASGGPGNEIFHGRMDGTRLKNFWMVVFWCFLELALEILKSIVCLSIWHHILCLKFTWYSHVAKQTSWRNKTRSIARLLRWWAPDHSRWGVKPGNIPRQTQIKNARRWRFPKWKKWRVVPMAIQWPCDFGTMYGIRCIFCACAFSK